MVHHTSERPAAGRAVGRVACVVAALVGVGLLSVPAVTAQKAQPDKIDRQMVEKILAEWPAKPNEVAEAMIAKYGPPHEATSTHLVWHNNGPWKWSILYRKEVPHSFPKKHTDVLDQGIDYHVPPDKFSQLAAYDGSVTVRRTKGEMSAMCDKEEMNLLALNLAHDIVTGEKNVEEARQFYTDTAMAFMKGKKHPYTQGFQFKVPKGGTADPDKKTAK